MAAVIGDLDVGNQQAQKLALLGLPDDFFVEKLAAAGAQQFDDTVPMRQVMPEAFGIEQIQLLLLIAEQVAHAPIVEENAPVLVDDAHGGRTVIQDFAKLAFLLHDLELVLGQRGDVVDPEHPLAADEADVAAAIGHLRVGQQQVQELAGLGAPDHLFVEQLAASVPQRRDDSRTLLEVVPELARVEAVELVFLIAQELAQLRVVEQQPAILVHDQQRRRTEFQDFAELALVLRSLGAGRAAAIGRCRWACCRVGRHAVWAPLSWPRLASQSGEFEAPRLANADRAGTRVLTRCSVEIAKLFRGDTI